MRATAFCAHQRAVGRAQGQLEHARYAQGHGKLGVGAGDVAAGKPHVLGALQQFLQLGNACFQILAVTENTHMLHHDALHGVAQGVAVVTGTAQQGSDALLDLGGSVLHGLSGENSFVTFEEFHQLCAHNAARNDGLGQRVAAKAVEAVHIPAGCFASGEKPFKAIGVPILVDAYAAHAVVVGGPYRNKLVDGVYAQEVR